MTASPFGRIHLSAVLGGNAITADWGTEAAFKLVIISNRAADKNFATRARYIRCGSRTCDLNDQRLSIVCLALQTSAEATAPAVSQSLVFQVKTASRKPRGNHRHS